MRHRQGLNGYFWGQASPDENWDMGPARASADFQRAAGYATVALEELRQSLLAAEPQFTIRLDSACVSECRSILANAGCVSGLLDQGVTGATINDLHHCSAAILFLLDHGYLQLSSACVVGLGFHSYLSTVSIWDGSCTVPSQRWPRDFGQGLEQEFDKLLRPGMRSFLTAGERWKVEFPLCGVPRRRRHPRVLKGVAPSRRPRVADEEAVRFKPGYHPRTGRLLSHASTELD